MIPRRGRYPGEGNGYPLQASILAWRIPWTEEPRGLHEPNMSEPPTLSFILGEVDKGYTQPSSGDSLESSISIFSDWMEASRCVLESGRTGQETG